MVEDLFKMTGDELPVIEGKRMSKEKEERKRGKFQRYGVSS